MRQFSIGTVVFTAMLLGRAIFCGAQTWEQGALRPGQMINLKQQLETGLQARLPEEFEYIEKVVMKVDMGELPERFVRQNFAYARKQAPYPIRYFDRALRIRGKKLGYSNIPVLPVKTRS